MKRLFTLCFLLVSSFCFAQEGAVSFSVDMNTYAGTQTLGAENVFVNGVFNGWCGDCNPLTDDNGDGIYTGEYPLPVGINEYKFTVNGWEDEESLLPEFDCVVTIGENTNRIVVVVGDMAAPTSCWNACTDCAGGGAAADGEVTFSVDMTDYAGGQILTGSNVYVSGTFNEWSGDGNAMNDDDGDLIYTATIAMPAGVQDFKFTVNNWADQEMFNGGETCIQSFGEFHNRLIVVDGNATLDTDCFNSCDDCGVVQAQPGTISLSVNMSEYAGTETLTANNVYVSGAFNEWCGDCAPLDDSDGDGIYSGDIAFPAGMQQFKFTINNWVDQEEFAGDESCVFSDGEFHNRVIDVDGDATYDVSCFASCFDCGESGIEDFDFAIQLFPNPIQDILQIDSEELIDAIQIIDLTGKTIYNVQSVLTREHQVDMSAYQAGIYFITISKDGTNQTHRMIKK